MQNSLVHPHHYQLLMIRWKDLCYSHFKKMNKRVRKEIMNDTLVIKANSESIIQCFLDGQSTLTWHINS